MKLKSILSLFMILALVTAVFTLVVPAAANPGQLQVVYQTPTAMPDGRILYKVKENDTCISISVLNNIPLQTLRNLNDLQGENCFLRTGQELLLGVIEATAAPAVTPTPTLLVGGTPFTGNGEVCITLFDDINGNGLAEDGETTISGGAASISDRAGKVSLTGQTTGSGDPLCFKDVPSGEYTLSLAVPDGYNATTAVKYTLKLAPGDRSTLDFGAQVSSAGTGGNQGGGAAPVAATDENRSPIMAILGGVLVLAGVGLGIYFRSMRAAKF